MFGIVLRTIALLALTSLALDVSAADWPDYRLPAAAAPQSQRIELRLDPSQSAYHGTTVIELSITDSVERIGINQIGLELSAIELRSAGGTRQLSATAGEWDRSWLADGTVIAPGTYTLSLAFAGTLASDALGMYRSRFEDNDYIFTQMEAMYARRAFPLFDEPGFKIPYQLVIEAPEDLTVVANTPPDSVAVEDGWQRVTFLPTPPLPSYLIAYAVGPLDAVAIEGLPVPGRVYVPRGHGNKLGFVLEHTPRIVAWLEDYFDFPYPYRKLDFVAVPDFAFGAMENPGLITYRDNLLLRGDEAHGDEAVATLGVIMHEVAHIWFGDVVTMAWWDDLWLNEAFASWMTSKALDALYPQYEDRLSLPQDRAFASDQLTTSQSIRAEVRTEEEVFEKLGLNYSKGESLLRMLESHVGSDVWQRAIRNYVRKFAWRNAVAADLWSAVSQEAEVDIGNIADTYLEQPGFATVTVDGDGAVTQQRYVRQGFEVEPQLWQVPLNVKYKADGQVRQTQLLLRGKKGVLDMPSDSDWIFPDAGGNGYYRWSTGLDSLYQLVDDVDELDNREKLALLDNSQALLDAGSLALDDYLYVVTRLLRDPHPLVFAPALRSLSELAEDLVAPSNRDAFAAYIDRILGARYRKLGMQRRDGDSEAVVRMRPQLIWVLGRFGADEQVRRDAAELTAAYLDAPDAADPDVARTAMRLTAMHGDKRLYQRYVDTYLHTSSVNQKRNVMNAMFFDDPELIRRHLAFTLTDDVDAGSILRALATFAYVFDDHALLYEWLEDNFDAVLARAPQAYQPMLARMMGSNCSVGNRALLQDFFAARGEVFAAGLAKAVESQTACIQRKERHAAGFQQFLERVNEEASGS